MIELSICISVHNTADYLPRCLDSIIALDNLEYEIIIVNNGSTDNSEEIMLRYQKKYPNIHIIRQNDMGLAQGRQTGVNNARGEYITFLDADDYVFNNVYEKAVNYAKSHDLDVVEFCTKRGDLVLKSSMDGIHNSHEVLKEYFWGSKTIYPMMWLRIYKRSLFESKPVLPKLYVNNEDIFAYPCILFSASQIGFLPDVGHNYSVDNSSAVMTQLRKDKNYSKKYYENRKKTLLCIKHIEKFIGKDIIDDEFYKEFQQYKQRTMITYLFSDINGVSISRLKNDLVKQFGFTNKRQLMKFIKTNTGNKSDVNKIIKCFGFNIAYLFHRIRKATR